MMKNKTKFILFSLILAMVTSVFTGCKTFDYSGYIKAMLDSVYKNDHKVYADLTNTSEEQLEEQYSEGINAEIEKFLSYMNISDSASFVNENTRAFARTFFETVYQSAQYSVKESNKNGYVTISISSIDILESASADLDAYVDDFFKKNDEGQFASLSDEDFYSNYIQGAIQILNQHIETLGYKDPVDVTVHVKPNKQNVYMISDEEFLKIDSLIIDYTR